ncbi:MAG: hypothetical protein P9L96_05245, partial [Candidatus Gygaella obscura]|nr:hypothetical protein [Candidatus Gygaella obscura]
MANNSTDILNNVVSVSEDISKKLSQQPSKTKRLYFPIDYKQINLFKDVNPLEWEDWHWQIKNRIRRKEELQQLVNLIPEEEKGL